MLLFVPAVCHTSLPKGVGSSGPVVCSGGRCGQLTSEQDAVFRGVTGGVGEASEWPDRASQVFEQNC